MTQPIIEIRRKCGPRRTPLNLVVSVACVVMTLGLVAGCSSKHGDTDNRSGTKRERWVLAFDPPIEFERGLGENGIVYSPQTLFPVLDRTGDQVTGICEWSYSDTSLGVQVGISGTLTSSRAHLVLRDDKSDLVVLDGTIKNGIASGTAAFKSRLQGSRNRPVESRFTLTPANQVGDNDASVLAAFENRDRKQEWHRAVIAGTRYAVEAAGHHDNAALAIGERTLSEAAAIAEKLTGVTADSDRAVTLNNLGYCQYSLGRYADAEKTFTRAAEYAQKVRWWDHSTRLAPHAILSNLALTLEVQNKPLDAVMPRLTEVDRKLGQTERSKQIHWLNAP